jgi:hypothetical protein
LYDERVQYLLSSEDALVALNTSTKISTGSDFEVEEVSNSTFLKTYEVLLDRQTQSSRTEVTIKENNLCMDLYIRKSGSKVNPEIISIPLADIQTYIDETFFSGGAIQISEHLERLYVLKLNNPNEDLYRLNSRNVLNEPIIYDNCTSKNMVVSVLCSYFHPEPVPSQFTLTYKHTILSKGKLVFEP